MRGRRRILAPTCRISFRRWTATGRRRSTWKCPSSTARNVDRDGQRVSRRRNTTDATGKIRVTVTLVGKGSTHVRGNIVRSFTYANTTVSTIAGRIAREIGRASCRERGVDLGGRRII